MLLAALSAACHKTPTSAAPAAATTPPAQSPRFADAGSQPALDRAPQDLTLDGGRKVRISFWRFAPAPGRSEARVTSWCGVGLERQALTVIGVDITEALSCDGVTEVGALPGGRIGLIYRTASPNSKGVTSLILTKAGGVWRVDADLTERLWDRSAATLADLRKLVR